MAKRMSPEVEAALVTEVAKKSGLLWVLLPVLDRPRAVWHVWVDDTAYVVCGGREQPLPGIDALDTIQVSARSKDNGALLVTFEAQVHRVVVDSDEWERVVPALHAARLNPLDGEEQPRRWARESEVWGLTPTGTVLEAPGRLDDGSRASAPPPSRAVTTSPLPLVLHRRQRRRPSLTE